MKIFDNFFASGYVYVTVVPYSTYISHIAEVTAYRTHRNDDLYTVVCHHYVRLPQRSMTYSLALFCSCPPTPGTSSGISLSKFSCKKDQGGVITEAPIAEHVDTVAKIYVPACDLLPLR